MQLITLRRTQSSEIARILKLTKIKQRAFNSLLNIARITATMNMPRYLSLFSENNLHYSHLCQIYCNRLLDFESHQEEAKSLLREISSSQKPSEMLSPLNKQRKHLVIQGNKQKSCHKKSTLADTLISLLCTFQEPAVSDLSLCVVAEEHHVVENKRFHNVVPLTWEPELETMHSFPLLQAQMILNKQTRIIKYIDNTCRKAKISQTKLFDVQKP